MKQQLTINQGLKTKAAKRGLMTLSLSLFLLSLMILLTNGCSLFRKHADEKSKAPETAATTAPADKTAKSAVVIANPPITSTPAPTPVPSATPAPVAGATTFAPQGEVPPGTPTVEHSVPLAQMVLKKLNAGKSTVSAETSLRWLKNGNIRFYKKHFRADGRSEKDRKRLTSEQKPHAIVLSCSDSRVPPELVFDQGLGEIYVIRVAGEVIDDVVLGTIEQAVEEYGSKLLVVMGHTQCDTVKKAVESKDGASDDAIGKVLSSIQTHLKTLTTEKPSPNLQVEATLNADGVARELLKRSDVLRQRVEAGELFIKPALYRLDSGKVSFY
jgi:carbonic anhydrase